MKSELERLVALYASGQLSDAERQQLFAAALEDQELFEALAHEDSVLDVLAMPGARGRLVDGLKPKRSRWFAWAGGLATAAAAAVVLLVVRTNPERTAPVIAEAPAVAAPAPVLSAPVEPKLSQPAPVPKAAKPVSISDSVVAQVEAKKKEAAPVIQETAEAAPRQVMEGRSASASRAAPLGASAGAVMKQRLLATQPIYTIQRKNAEGVFEAVPPDEFLKKGEAIRISLVAPVTGQMIANAGQIITQTTTAGQRYYIPPTGEIVLDQSSGSTSVIVSFAPKGVSNNFRETTPGMVDPVVPFEIRINYK